MKRVFLIAALAATTLLANGAAANDTFTNGGRQLDRQIANNIFYAQQNMREMQAGLDRGDKNKFDVEKAGALDYLRRAVAALEAQVYIPYENNPTLWQVSAADPQDRMVDRSGNRVVSFSVPERREATYFYRIKIRAGVGENTRQRINVDSVRLNRVRVRYDGDDHFYELPEAEGDYLIGPNNWREIELPQGPARIIEVRVNGRPLGVHESGTIYLQFGY